MLNLRASKVTLCSSGDQTTYCRTYTENTVSKMQHQSRREDNSVSISCLL